MQANKGIAMADSMCESGEPRKTPRLLVSVRDPSEARLAATTPGVSIVDVKDPSRGALGCPSPPALLGAIEAVAGRRPMSVALGEWSDPPGPQTLGLARRPVDEGADPASPWTAPRSGGAARASSAGSGGASRTGDRKDSATASCEPSAPTFVWPAFVKIGLAEAAGRASAWVRAAREAFEAWRPAQPVLVAYADATRVAAPPLDDVLAAARRLGAAVLIDTAVKDGSSLIDHLPAPRIDRLLQQCDHLALAGSLDEKNVRRLIPRNPWVIGVRGAACRAGRRGDALDPARLTALAEAFGPIQAREG